MDNTSVFFQTDCGSIVSQIKNQEKQLRLKQRWLLGCDMSESDTDFLKSEFLPESLLREDDISYETVKSRVEESFGFRKSHEVLTEIQQKESKLTTNDVITKLDSLTNKALYLIATIVTKDTTISFEKTRPKMKEIIKESIDIEKEDIVKELHKVFNDSENFRTPTSQSHRDAAMKILNELDKLSTQTLLAMKRKLKGTKKIPRLKIGRCGESRSKLIKQVKDASEKMLSELSDGDGLPEKLAKAMSLVDLSLKLTPDYETATTEFYQFSEETKSLQNDIVKAVWLVNKKVRFSELKRMRLLLDPEAEVSKDSLRAAVKRMLIEYLLECSDMESIPESLKEALLLVNRNTRDVEHNVFLKESIEEETECVLNVSAQVKELVWECVPKYELDEDFDDAYMEELEDSEDDNDNENCSLFDNEQFISKNKIKNEVKETEAGETDSSDSDLEEGGAECSFMDLNSSVNRVVIRDLEIHPQSVYVTPTSNKSSSGASKTRVKVEKDTEMEIDDNDNHFSARSLFSVENIKTDDHNHGEEKKKPQGRNKNQYLALQEISDETSLVAHNLIGKLLEKFADREGIELEPEERSYLGGGPAPREEKEASSQEKEKSDESIVVSVVKELMPSLENSVLMRLKELMDG